MLILAAIGGSGSCIEPPRLIGRDAARVEAASLVVESITARERSGAACSLEALPRAFVVEVAFSEPIALDDVDPAFLVRGAPDDALRADVARLPLNASTRERMASSVTMGGAVAIVAPTVAAGAGEVWTLVVGGWAETLDGRSLGTTQVIELRVSDAASAGARVVATFPADGTPDVPAELPRVLVALDGRLATFDDGLRASVGGVALEGTTEAIACDAWGALAPVECLAWTPRAPWPRGSEVALATTDVLVDATGAAVPSAWVSFRVASADDSQPPALVAPERCGVDEVMDAAGCVTATDSTLEVALVASEPVFFELTLAGHIERAIAPRGEWTFRREGLAVGTTWTAGLALTDLAGHRTESSLELATTGPLSPLTIAEVCADPEGPEPAQEWVELVNLGSDDASLEGIAIADRTDSLGTSLGSSRVVAPGARVLVVGDAFDADLAAVPAGAVLVRVGRTIVTGGITNAGEALYLRDASGHRLAHVPALAADEGRCVVRDESRGPRADAIEVFHYDACSPGR